MSNSNLFKASAVDSTEQQNVSKTRKQIIKKLSTGQKISLTTGDERTLKAVYDYLSGYATRQDIEATLEIKRQEVNQLHQSLPPSARLILQMSPRHSAHINKSDLDPQHLDPDKNSSENGMKNENEIALDAYYRAKEQFNKVEEKLKIHSAIDHKIGFKDLDAVLKKLGMVFHRRQIEQMIWEVDENMDELIDFDELQLTYFRNLSDKTGNEPCYFFKILEFLIFDASHKGYVIEDDCMEILYGRYGGGHLEQEMKLLFGSRLRAEGGDGTLNLEAYLDSVLNRLGRRALLF